MPTITTSDCFIYANGIVHCSVCVPKRWTAEMIEKEVNEISPTGISYSWKISKDTKFNSGEPMPCPCNDSATERMHWLLEC